ncbi:hypothetical protein Plhal304r1_c025g0084801 [Plasmopara halstedii]
MIVLVFWLKAAGSNFRIHCRNNTSFEVRKPVYNRIAAPKQRVAQLQLMTDTLLHPQQSASRP